MPSQIDFCMAPTHAMVPTLPLCPNLYRCRQQVTRKTGNTSDTVSELERRCRGHTRRAAVAVRRACPLADAMVPTRALCREVCRCRQQVTHAQEAHQIWSGRWSGGVQRLHQKGCSGREEGLVPLREQRGGLLVDGRAAPQDVWRGRPARPAHAAQDAVRLPACQRGDKPCSVRATITSYQRNQHGAGALQRATGLSDPHPLLVT